MAKLSPKNSTQIASLYNAVIHAEAMQRKGYNFDLWQEYRLQAAKTLRDVYGIAVIGVFIPGPQNEIAK